MLSNRLKVIISQMSFPKTTSLISVLASPATTQNNPYTSLLYEGMEESGWASISEFSFKRSALKSFDICHIHWPDGILNRESRTQALYNVTVFLIVIWIQKIRGAKIVWTAHNTESHERRYPAIEALLWQYFIPMLDGVIYLSTFAQTAVESVHKSLLEIPSKIIPHGHYRSIYPNFIPKSNCREILSIPEEKTVVAFIGTIRSYKNVPNLIRKFSQLTSLNLMLLIAGSTSDTQLLTEVKEAADRDKRVRLDNRFIPPDELQIYLNCADLVILPFRKILNSGSTLLALSFNRPVLVPRAGSLPELQSRLGSQWLRLYDSELSPDTIEDGIQWSKESNDVREERVDLREYEWNAIKQKTFNFYLQLLASS